MCKPMLSWDGVNIGSVLSPHEVSLMEAVEMRNKKRAGLLLLCIAVLLAASNTISRTRLRLGGVQCPCNDSWLEGYCGCHGEELTGEMTRKQNPEGHPWATTISCGSTMAKNSKKKIIKALSENVFGGGT